MRGIGIALFLSLALAAPANEVPAPAPVRVVPWAVQSSGVTTSLNGVTFLNAKEGFVAGAGGVILRTLDGARTAWQPQTTDTTTAVLNAVALDGPDAGLAVGNSGVMLRTANGKTGSPSTWNTISTGTLAAVAATDATHVWTGSLTGKLRSTADGGTTWPMVNPGVSGFGIRGMSFWPGSTEGYWVGDGGNAAKKASTGTTWAPMTTGVSSTLNSISIAPGGTTGTATGWIAGAVGTLLVTADSGGSWMDAGSGVTVDLNGVSAMSATYAWAVGAQCTIVALKAPATTWATQVITDPMLDTTLALNAVAFTGAAPNYRGIAVGEGGKIYRTVNSGILWQPGVSNVTSILRGVAWLNSTTAIAVGDNGVLLKSIDSGANWNLVSSGLITEDIRSVTMLPAGNGWAVGSGGTILTTAAASAGSTWTLQMGESSRPLTDVKFASPGVALAVGAGAKILRTSNGGDQWIPLATPAIQWLGRDVNAVAFGTATRAVAVGPTGGILVTTNTGDLWTLVSPSITVTEPLTSVTAVTPTFFVAVGSLAASKVVAINFDPSTSTWTADVETAPPSDPVKAVSFAPSASQGYAVGDRGVIQVTTDSGSTWALESSGVATTININGVSSPSPSIAVAVCSSGDILVRRAPDPPLLSFPPHQGTPYTYQPPLIDGYVNPEDSEVRRPDTGWDRSLRVTYDDGTSDPPLKFQALRHNSGGYIYLSFEMRGDTAFNDDDTIVLLLRGDNPTAAPDHAANDRRIIINPVTTGTGAAAGMVVAPSGEVDSMGNEAPHTFPYTTNRENGAPRQILPYRWDMTSNAWVGIPTNAQLDCKVRSWVPASGSNCWSVEVQIPTSSTTYTDWINIGTDFLFSFYVIRVQTGGAIEFSWPRDMAVFGPVDVIDAPFPASDWGPAKLGVAGDGQGVQVQDPYSSNIGVTRPATGTTWMREISRTQLNTFHVKVANTSAVPALLVQPTFRIADWGIQSATLGQSGNPSSGAWRLVPSETATPNPPAAQTIPANTGTSPVEFTFTWQMSGTQPADYAPPHQHQCVMVTLDSPSNVIFTQRSVWTNMDSVPASRFERPATVSAKGYGLEAARGGKQRFYLHATSERFDYVPGKTPLDVVAPPAEQDRRSEKKGDHPYYSAENLKRVRLLKTYPDLKAETSTASYYTWAIHAARESSKTVKINGHVYPILDPATGFGYQARHGNSVSEWTSGLSGAVVTELSNTEWRVDVPANGSVLMDTSLEAHDGGCFLWVLIAMILMALLLIFWFLKKKP